MVSDEQAPCIHNLVQWSASLLMLVQNGVMSLKCLYFLRRLSSLVGNSIEIVIYAMHIKQLTNDQTNTFMREREKQSKQTERSFNTIKKYLSLSNYNLNLNYSLDVERSIENIHPCQSIALLLSLFRYLDNQHQD